MKPSFWKWLLAASLSLNAGFIGVVLFNQVRLQTVAAPAPAASVNLPDYLQLSPEQRAHWRQSEAVFLKDIDDNWKEIRRYRETLVRHVFASTPDPAAINAAQARIAALQDAQQRRVIVQLLAERDLLDEAQRARLMNLLLSRYARESSDEEKLHRD